MVHFHARLVCCCVVLFTACAPAEDQSPDAQAPDSGGYLDDPSGPLPETMSELGLYPEPGDFDLTHPRALAYRPEYQLWSNGSHKERQVVLPKGGVVDSHERDSWRFPASTIFLKTFFYADEDEAEQPVETRVLRQTEDGLEYAVYLWNEAGTDATRADIARPIAVSVTTEGETFEHHVPAKIECRKCHESQPVAVLGFDELGLNGTLEGADSSQLEALFEAGVLSDMPDAPDAIDEPDPSTREALGYFEGNCVHCHNGSGGPSSSFDLRHGVALENLIGRETEGESVGGIRILPGDADSSAVYRALEGGRSFPDVAQMPPVGVDRRDEAAIERFRSWIEAMPHEEESR